MVIPSLKFSVWRLVFGVEPTAGATTSDSAAKNWGPLRGAQRQTPNAKRQIPNHGTAASCYGHAGRSVAELELEVGELLRKAERADTTPRDDGLDLPAEIERRQKRLEALRKARAVIEERARERAAKERPEYERKACDPESASPETLHPRAFTGHVSPR